MPLTNFYDTPKPLPAGKPGELIRSEPADEYYLSADFSAFRILYHSRSATGQDVAASGVVLVPSGTPPAGGWPVIAWAHGFSGGGRQCAPSLLRNLYYGPFLSMYVDLGYAVVATDYTGLGTDFRNAVMDLPSDATDVIDSIPAAHMTVTQLGPKWVAMGPSLGANVALAVAEEEHGLHDSDYLGSIAISGIADLQDIYSHPTTEKSVGMLAFVAYTLKTVYPGFDISNMLTEKALPRYHEIDEDCGSSVNSGGLSANQMLNGKWKDDEFVKKFFGRNALGQKPARGPLLVIGNGDDSEGLPAMTDQTVDRMCKQGDRVDLDKFFDPQPGLVIGDSVRDQMAWIGARFAGRSAPDNCR
ncbi:MAG: lipase family protein [Terriglobales bacterium]